MQDETNDYGNRVLPDNLYTYGKAATACRALGDFFEQNGDSMLAQMADSMASVTEARHQYESDTSRYGARVTFVDDDGDAHTAIVLEPEVATMAADEAYDPYRDEMVDPREEYPLGTVQLVYPTGDQTWPEDFVFSRTKDLEVATSVTPAKEPGQTYCYFSGWDYAHSQADE